jgi:hypothetical protein
MFLVPTLDIDLAWHSHQLMADKYNRDCIEYVGRYIDQYVNHNVTFEALLLNMLYSDDKVEEGRLSTSFDGTGDAWQVGLKLLCLCHGIQVLTSNFISPASMSHTSIAAVLSLVKLQGRNSPGL